MRVELGQHIKDREGNDVGRVQYLILDPDTRNVKTVVVERGFLFKDDIEIPLEHLQTAPDDAIHVDRSAQEIDRYPRFDRGAYSNAPADFVPAGYPPMGLLWPGAYPSAATPNAYGYPVVAAGILADNTTSDTGAPNRTDQTRIAEERRNAVITEGSDVVTRDGQKVGEVGQVAFDASTGRPLGLTVRRGFLFTKDTEIPGSLIASVDDETVYLNVDRAHFERGEWEQAA